MDVRQVSKQAIGFIGGAITACVGTVISVNPVTIKIMEFTGKFFSGSVATLAGEIVLKVSGLICIGGLSYLIAKNVPDQYKAGFITGAIVGAVVDLAAYIYVTT